MYSKLLYVTLTSESVNEAIAKIKREVGHLIFEVWNEPIKLTGNARILELHDRHRDTMIKVDGPGFLINDLYRYFA